MSGPSIERAATIGLVPQEWCPGGNRCMKPTNGKTGRCWNRARWCDTAAAERYDQYDFDERDRSSYAYKVCDRHASLMAATPNPDGEQ